MRCPAEWYEATRREGQTRPAPPAYPGHSEERRVRTNAEVIRYAYAAGLTAD